MLNEHVFKTVLSNGMTVLILPRHQIPKVSIQLWYNVGSKDEKSGEKGIAHLIEHMIFKGTTKLSESDINMITHKLSGSCNAFTSYDYTGYLFDMPSQHWQEVLPIMSDCMRNCTFKEDSLNSELKAVIQELKMYNDDYVSTLIERMVGNIFSDHPYHHPIIGYKQDLWNLKRDALVNFYKHHYVPNNAVLVLVGDVDLEQAIEEVEQHFSAIPADTHHVKEEFYHGYDLESQAITLYRDIQQPMVLLAWVIPGTAARKDYLFDLISWIIGAGKGSRLYSKIVDELELATELESFAYDLFEHGLFFIHFQPKNINDTQKIVDIINHELEHLAQVHVNEHELQRAIKKTEVDFLSLQENNQKLAYLLGKFYLATGDENYLTEYCDYPRAHIKDDIQAMIKNYLRPTIMYRGQVLPLPEKEQEFWHQLQNRSDEEDARVLGRILRDSQVETATHVHNITVQPPPPFNFPKPETFELSNGIKVLYYNNPQVPKIDVILDLKAKHYYDPEDLLGLNMIMSDMLQEGTPHYSAQEFARELESHGMELSTFPGQVSMSMLSADLSKGLALIMQVLTQATMTKESLEKVRAQLLAELKNFWDSPSTFSGHLVREEIYKGHPYSKNVMGNSQTVKNIAHKNILQAYKDYISPDGAKLVVVGDLSSYDIKKLLEETLGALQGPQVPDMQFPELQKPTAQTINYPINRDQTVLCFAGLSVARESEDFDKLLLFDQVFTGGVLGSMSSRLFALREQSGLFYTIGGSLLAGVDHQPGMVFIKTIVSNDRLLEAEQRIEKVINDGAQSLTDVEHEEAQHALINSLVDHFASNRQIASTFLFLDAFDFPADYFDKRAQQFLSISRTDVQKTIAKFLNTKHMIKLRVGRIQ